MSIPQEIFEQFNKKYFKRDNQYYKLSELNIAFKYLKIIRWAVAFKLQ
jgi:hypothetical protein